MRFSSPQPNAIAQILGSQPMMQDEAAHATGDAPWSPEELDQIAQGRGYRNYQHMIYVMENGLPQPKPQQAQAPQGGSAFDRPDGGIMNVIREVFTNPRGVIEGAKGMYPVFKAVPRAEETLRNSNRR